MASSTSAAANKQHHCDHAAMPAPPPPTPSNRSLAMSLPTDAVEDSFSRALDKLMTTPNLSLPITRLSRLSASAYGPPTELLTSEPSEPPISPPIISLHEEQETQEALLLSAACEFGFFHLEDHGVPSDIPFAAVAEARSLLKGVDCRDEEDGSGGGRKLSLELDISSCDLDGLMAVREFARALERLAAAVVEMLLHGGEEATRRLMWISSSSTPKEEIGEDGEKMMVSCHPYVVCLQYEMKGVEEPWSVIGDSGECISIAHRADSVLVTLGDIAQVWSNGRFKKARGIPQQKFVNGCGDSGAIYMSLFLCCG